MSPDFVNTIGQKCGRFGEVNFRSLDEELGFRLQAERKKLGISQSYLAGLLHRDQTSLSKMENGSRQISVSDFLTWCKAMNLTWDDAMELLKIGPFQSE